jgi:acetyltransferase-like isoleucine patch superfamily enzyme
MFDLLKKFRNVQVKLYTALVRSRFKRLSTYLDPRVDIVHPEFVTIGTGTNIRPYTYIYAITEYQDYEAKYTPSIVIGNNCSIGRFCYITCSNLIVIENDVFIMESVLITDSGHSYVDINTPIIYQPIVSNGPVIIGAGSWIGAGAKIIGKLKIGSNCVVAANAVVTRDVPDYCVVAGVPARVVKQYNPDTQTWEIR